MFSLLKKIWTALKKDLRDYFVLGVICSIVLFFSFVLKPHGCETTYGPAPYYYNTDLTLWVQLSENPIGNLSHSILANRPVFAWLGFIFSQPLKLLTNDMIVESKTRSGGKASIAISKVGGLFLANALCFYISSILLYCFTLIVTEHRKTAILSAILFATSSYAFAWSYHPINMLSGLLLIFGFPLFLFYTVASESFPREIIFTFIFGILFLMKAYYIFPIIYVIWGLYHKRSIPLLSVGLLCLLLPTFLWRILYFQITGSALIDYHLGAHGLIGYLSMRILSWNSLKILFHEVIRNLVLFPVILFKSAGPIITTTALGFYFVVPKENRLNGFILFSIIYIPGLFIFLTFIGFFIPRHGSDFFPILFPAASMYIHFFMNQQKIRKKYIYSLVIIYFLLTLLSYSQPWICASEFM